MSEVCLTVISTLVFNKHVHQLCYNGHVLNEPQVSEISDWAPEHIYHVLSCH